MTVEFRAGERVSVRYPHEATERLGTVRDAPRLSVFHPLRPACTVLLEVIPDALNLPWIAAPDAAGRRAVLAGGYALHTMLYAPEWAMRLAIVPAGFWESS